MPGGKHSYQSLAITPTGTGDQTILAAPAERKSIYVVAIALVASAATVATIKSGAVSLSGPISLAANGGFTLTAPGEDSWLFKTSPGEALIIGQTADGVDGFLTYYVG